jgi:hypothetical protein
MLQERIEIDYVGGRFCGEMERLLDKLPKYHTKVLIGTPLLQ